jgi:hypothetical protein
MDFEQMQQDLRDIVLDQSPAILLMIPDLINEAVQNIAEEIKFSELKQVTSAVTDPSRNYVNLSATFSSRLKYAGNSDGAYKILDGGLEELIKLYPGLDEVGDIEYVTLEGRVLYYQPIPSVATTITCIGYHSPAVLVNAADTPSFIPSWLRREAIVNTAAAILYSRIEDGVEVEKINSKIFRNLAEVGMHKIRAYVSRRRPVVSQSNWSY